MGAPSEVVTQVQALAGLSGVTTAQIDAVWPWVEAVIGSHHRHAVTMRAYAVAHALERDARAAAMGLGAAGGGALAGITTKSLSQSYHAPAAGMGGGALASELATTTWGARLLVMLEASASSAPMAL